MSSISEASRGGEGESHISEPSEGLKFLNLIGKLKGTKRTGWVYSGVEELTRVESVADHSWRMSVAAFLYANDPAVDIGKMIRLAVVHDMAEVFQSTKTNTSSFHSENENRFKSI